MTRTKTNFVTQQQLKTMRGGRGLGHTHPNKDILDKITEDMLSSHPYISLERLQEYLYRVTFDRLPEDNGGDNPQPAACSAYVKDGKLYRNLDFNYDDAASFIVRTRDFEGMSFITGLNDGAMDDELIAQLPYRIVDGTNKYGIKVAVLVLFNDWDWTGTGERSISLTRLPYLILSRVKSMATISTDLAGVLDNLFASETLQATGYLLQVMVTDLTTTYAVIPPTREGRSYELMDITDCPKLTNFRPVGRDQVSRADSDIQDRPTGIERYNMMPCPLEDLRFTKAYESQDRLSEFIGIRDTTKDSTDAELLAIYRDARTEYLRRQRDGLTWQTMHSNVYGSRMEELYVQERWNLNCIGLEFAQLPDVFIAGTKAKPEESDEELKRITRLCFTAGELTDELVDLEVVMIDGKRVLHTSLPFASDDDITAGGVGEEGGESGDLIVIALEALSGLEQQEMGKVPTAWAAKKMLERIEALEQAPAGGVTSFNGRTGAVSLTAADVESVISISGIENAIESLQSQVDAVASKDAFDELTVSSLFSDTIAAEKGWFADLNILNGLPKSSLSVEVQNILGKVADTEEALLNLRQWIESMFAKDEASVPGKTFIHALLPLYSDDDITAGGVGEEGGESGDLIVIALEALSGLEQQEMGKVPTAWAAKKMLERIEALEQAPAGGVTSFNGRTGAVSLTAADVESVISISGIENAIESLQSQVDAVASKDAFDELTVSSLFSDTIAATAIYGVLYGNAATASDSDTLDGQHASAFATAEQGSHGETAYNDLTLVGAALQSLQSQIDSVASKKEYDEIIASCIYGDMIVGTNIYGALHGNADSATSAGNADKVDGEHASSFAHRATWNNLIHSGNEFTYVSGGYNGVIWHNYRTASGSTDGNITDYYFGNGKGGSLVALSTLISEGAHGETAYNELTMVSKALQALQSQIDSIASRDFSDLSEGLAALKAWIESMFELTSEGIHAKHHIFSDGDVTAGD